MCFDDVAFLDQSQVDNGEALAAVVALQKYAMAASAGITTCELERLELGSSDEIDRDVVGVNMIKLATLRPKIWILEGLIEYGDQVLIAGAPKSGKSLLSSQIALAVTSGGRFLKWQAPSKMQIVYVNLEIRRANFGERIFAQMGGWENNEIYSSFVAIDDMQTIDILNVDERTALQRRIARSKPQLVIFDVLARCHNADEQSQAMKSVMLALRVCAGGAASIVVHHARKAAQGMDNVSQQASDIRGSSAIHGEVDTAIVLTKRSGQGPRFALTFSARNVDVPDEILLDRGDDLLFVEAGEDEKSRLKVALQAIYKAADSISATDLTSALCEIFSVGERSAKRHIKDAVECGLICHRRLSTGKHEYFIPTSSVISRTVRAC